MRLLARTIDAGDTPGFWMELYARMGPEQWFEVGCDGASIRTHVTDLQIHACGAELMTDIVLGAIERLWSRWMAL